MKKLTALLCVLALVLAIISGCGTPDGGGPVLTSDALAAITTGGILELDASMAYVAQTVTLQGDIRDVAYHGGIAYFAPRKTEEGDKEAPYLNYEYSEIYSIMLSGSEPAEPVLLEGYSPSAAKPAGTGGLCKISNLTTDGEGYIWVTEDWQFYSYDLPGNFDFDNDEMLPEYQTLADYGNVLRKLDSTGAEILSIDITNLTRQQGISSIAALAVCNDNETGDVTIYLHSRDGMQGTAYVLDGSGNVQFSIDTNIEFGHFIELPDGRVAIPIETHPTPDTRLTVLQVIDTTAKAPEETIAIPGFAEMSTIAVGYDYMRFFAVSGGYDVLIGNDVSLYGYTFGEEDSVHILNWLSSNFIVNRIGNVSVLPDGRLVCTSSIWDESIPGMRCELVIFTQIPVSELPEKTVLTLATVDSFLARNDIKDAVAAFNMENLYYRIEVKDYPHNRTQDGYVRFNTELIAGNVPDIIASGNLPSDVFASNTLFTDLYPFIDADPEFSRVDFVQSIFRNFEKDGHLYDISPGFSIYTVMGSPSVVGSNTGWTLEEFEAVLDAHPDADIPLGPGFDKINLLDMCVRAGVNEYVDWDSGTARFDTPEFVRLLQLCDRMPDTGRELREEVEYMVYLSEGRQIMLFAGILSFQWLRHYPAILGGEYVYKGFPDEDRNGHIIYTSVAFAITEASEHKEDAWMFLRKSLSEDLQADTVRFGSNASTFLGFPTNRAAFDDLAGRVTSEPTGIDYDTPTQADVDMIIELINSLPVDTPRIWSIEESLMNIITESASDYFNGQCTAEDAARVIQSKAAIYVSERSG